MKSAFAKLHVFEKNRVITRLELRRSIWSRVKCLEYDGSNSVMLVGDRPGPGAPKEPHYHHTAFYSTKNCSGWLNMLLEREKIPENRLIWINSADEHGNYYSADIVKCAKPRVIISLGGNAAKWLKKNGINSAIEAYHPQYWKRFHNKEPYPLIDLLKQILT